jgi:hypothetical protein
MLGQFPGILTEQPSTAFTEDAYFLLLLRTYESEFILLKQILILINISHMYFFIIIYINKNNTLIIA